MNPDSAYIEGLPDAEYEIMGNGSLSDSGLFSLAASLADRLMGNRRGWVFTTGINAAGLAKNPIDLQNYYSENAPVIDAYFDKINLQELAKMIGGEAEQAIVTGSLQWFKSKVPAFLVGAAIGAGGLYVYNQKFKKK